jgi:hypothetical protein
MSKNNLLNESTIRRFMKLADVAPLAESFVDRLSEMGHEAPGARHDDDKPVDEMHCVGGRDDDATVPGARDYMGEAEHEDEQLDVDIEEVPEDEDAAPVGDDPTSVEELARALLDTIQDLVPGLVTVEDEEEADLDVDAPAAEVEDMMETTDETLEEETVEEAAHDDTKKAMEETIDEVNVVEDDDLINEVAKRVTARLVKSLAARKKNS